MPKQSPYQRIVAETEPEITENELKISGYTQLLKTTTALFAGWSILGLALSVYQIQPLSVGLSSGIAFLAASVATWRKGIPWLETCTSLYVAGMSARFIFTTAFEVATWQKLGMGTLMGLAMLSCYWMIRDSTHVLGTLRSFLQNDIDPLRRRQNPDRYAYAQRTVASQRKRNKSGSSDFTETEWIDLCHEFNYTCLACGKVEPAITLTPDHVIPLARGGTNQIDNIQPLCQRCNSVKNAKTVDYRGAPI